MQFQITPIRSDFLTKVRESQIDDQNQPIVRKISTGGEPCRDVLRRAIAGEALILASYCPFSLPGPFKEYGAVFVLENHSDEVVNYDQFSVANNSGNDYFSTNLVLRAYDNEEAIHDARVVSPIEVEKTIGEFFENNNIRFIIARYTAYGCYALRLDRK